MKNILLVGNWSSDTGYAWWLMEAFWVAIAKKYRDRCRIIVCYPAVPTVPARLLSENIEVVEFKLSPKNPFDIVKFVKTNDVETVYLTDRGYTGALYFWLRVAGVKNIVLHDHTPGLRSVPGILRGSIKRIVSSLSMLSADAYIAVSDQIFKRFINVACIPESRCHVARNGIDVNKIASAQSGAIRAQINIPADAVLVVSSGRLTSYKGVQTVIEAASILVNQHGCENVFFIHAGDGPERSDFERIIVERSLERRFFLLGMRSDIPQLLKAADIAVHASQGEGLSLSILEFMCAGLPVVVSDDPTVSQSVRDGISGIHFKTGDAECLANKVGYLVKSPATRSRLGATASQDVKNNYSLDQTIETVLGIFDRVIDGSTSGSLH